MERVKIRFFLIATAFAPKIFGLIFIKSFFYRLCKARHKAYFCAAFFLQYHKIFIHEQ